MKAHRLGKAIIFLSKKIVEYGPEILSVTAASSAIAAVFMAVKATKKSCADIEEYKKENDVDVLSTKQIISLCWRNYVSTILMLTSSVTSIIGSASVNFRRKTVLAAACSLSEAAVDSYKDKIKKLVGEDKAKIVDEMVAKEIENKRENATYIYPKEQCTCIDTISGQVFKASYTDVMNAVNEFNFYMLSNDSAIVNMWYDFLGLKHCKFGRFEGWKIDNGLLHVTPIADISEDGEPLLKLTYDRSPIRLT